MEDEGATVRSERSALPSKEKIKEILLMISDVPDGVTGLRGGKELPPHGLWFVNEWFEGDTVAFLKRLEDLTAEVMDPLTRVVLKGGLGLTSEPNEVSQEYADRTKRQHGVSKKVRLGFARESWEEVHRPKHWQKLYTPKMDDEQKFRLATHYWRLGRRELELLLAADVEERRQARECQTSSTGDQEAPPSPRISPKYRMKLPAKGFLSVVRSIVRAPIWRRQAFTKSTSYTDDQGLELEEGEDSEEEFKPPAIRPGFAIGFGLAVATIVAQPFLLPVQIVPVLKAVDTFFLDSLENMFTATRLVTTILAVALIGFAFCLHSSIKSQRWIVAGICFASVLLLGTRLGCYADETARIDSLAAIKPSGDVLSTVNFGSTSNCSLSPLLGSRLRDMPLSACRQEQGLIQMSEESSGGIKIGAYPTASAEIHAVGTDKSPGPGYYLDARFKPDSGGMAACGLIIESNKGVLLLHVIWKPAEQNYYAEASAIDSIGTSKTELRSLNTSDNLPLVKRWTLWNPEYSIWTRLTVFMEKTGFVLMVNDRTAIRYEYPGLTDIYRGSLAVMAGSAANAGAASCTFDRVEAGTIPLS